MPKKATKATADISALGDTALVNDKTAALQFGVHRITFLRWVKNKKIAVQPVKITEGTTRFCVGEIRQVLAKAGA